MKTLMFVITILILFIAVEPLTAQRHRSKGGPDGPPPERLERFKKMRLIEVLKLNDDDAIRFFSKQSSHEDKIKEILDQRNDFLDQLEDLTKDKGEAKDIQKLGDQILDLDKKMFEERQRFQKEIRELLKPEQFAKFLVFDRNFGREVRGAIEDMYQEKRNRKGLNQQED